MDKLKMKKLLLRSLFIAGLTFGVFTMTPVTVEASNEYIDYEGDLPYEEFRLLKKYSKIFSIKYEYARDMFFEYQDVKDDYTKINGIQYHNDEEAILTFMYQLAYKPEELNLTKKEVEKCDYNYTMQLSHEEFIYYYSNLLGIDPEVALSISYAECGPAMDSWNWLNNNNPAGIGPSMKFDNKAKGNLYYLFLLRDSYKLGEKGDEEFFDRIAKTYCPDDPDHWLKLTKPIYNNVSEDYLYYNQDLKLEYFAYVDNSIYTSTNNKDQYQIVDRVNEYYGVTSPYVGYKTIKKIKSVTP